MDEACKASADVLADIPYAVPFAAIYVVGEGRTATLSAVVGLSGNHGLPASVSLAGEGVSVWSSALSQVLAGRRSEQLLS